MGIVLAKNILNVYDMFEFEPAKLDAFYASPTMFGIIFMAVLFAVFAGLIKMFPKSKFSLMFDLMYEKVYEFYEDILGEQAGMRVKMYITVLFFIILFANLASQILYFIAPMFGFSDSGEFNLGNYITIPTSDMSFNIALSLFSTLLLIYIQFGVLGFGKFLYSYFPLLGKKYIEIERGEMSALMYYPLAALAKTGDIVISLFLGFLDIIGQAAKVISLAFRLFGNMMSGTILLGMLVVGISGLTDSLFGINFPVVFPLIVYLQGLLVAVIQAMVFPLIVAISIRMVLMEGESA